MTTTMLFSELGMARDEGLIVAYLPEMAEVLQEYPCTDGTLYAIGEMAIDVIMDDYRPLKWWKFKNAARELRFSFPEPVWNGPAEDLSVQSLRQLPHRPGHKLAIRRYHAGPWITLSTEDMLKYD